VRGWCNAAMRRLHIRPDFFGSCAFGGPSLRRTGELSDSSIFPLVALTQPDSKFFFFFFFFFFDLRVSREERCLPGDPLPPPKDFRSRMI
jgi:hypothetical protein